MASLSDEETARALCAFQHTEPLPTQRRQPLQQPLRSTMPHLAPDGLATFGYPSNSTYHMVPMSRRNEAASVLMGMHTPSTSSGDWQRLQQRAIQDQIEQQQRDEFTTRSDDDEEQ
ncbi:Hypothetical protein PHPALM_4853 [Phytophthora palmivora]|uniref:Uncharacterized protein n=1 Tax=Phytophthora palmivora TaxID=4796 RepID=A0A2P4YJ08_9STRA|nr:Hypothetical protein PHPALM_4853 [Phytophthora palmivora]